MSRVQHIVSRRHFSSVQVIFDPHLCPHLSVSSRQSTSGSTHECIARLCIRLCELFAREHSIRRFTPLLAVFSIYLIPLFSFASELFILICRSLANCVFNSVLASVFRYSIGDHSFLCASTVLWPTRVECCPQIVLIYYTN